MTSDINLKVSWLKEAVMLLDTRDPVTGAHVPGIMKQLQNNLAALERSPGQYPIVASNDFRLLVLVIKSIASE
jgi:hypothetical protein